VASKKELRARAGSNRSPYGKVGCNFGPRTVVLKLNKERRLVLQTLLYNKKNNILIIENLENEITQPKTKLKNLSRLCD
jgi:ribosomal protein L4